MKKATPATETILPSSEKAAKKTTVEAWVSRNGHLYLDERTARWDGATHVSCGKCSATIPKGGWALCEACREKEAWARWNAAAKVDWDGSTPIFSDATDKYFFDTGELEDYCLDRETAPEDLRLYLCQPLYGREVDGDHFADELPEDGELPDEIVSAMEVFNKAVRECGPLSWEPSNQAVIVTVGRKVADA